MAVTVNLSGRRVLVTGASSGLGAEICRSLAGCGASVAMLARRGELLDALENELGATAKGFVCDVTDHAALEDAIAKAASAFGGLDALVAVAGRGAVGTLMTGSPEGWRALVDLNFIAPLASARHAIGYFPQSGRRDLLFVGSAASMTPMPGVGMYAATKRGLRAACDAMRLELAPAGVNVSMILPGAFETEGLVGNVDFNGELGDMGMVQMFVDDGQPAPPQSVGDSIAFMLGLPEGVCINELVIRPTSQLHP
jgi:NADP-dependent 3-hydroxy acid dehydrogenase YdfG